MILTFIRGCCSHLPDRFSTLTSLWCTGNSGLVCLFGCGLVVCPLRLETMLSCECEPKKTRAFKPKQQALLQCCAELRVMAVSVLWVCHYRQPHSFCCVVIPSIINVKILILASPRMWHCAHSVWMFAIAIAKHNPHTIYLSVCLGTVSLILIVTRPFTLKLLLLQHKSPPLLFFFSRDLKIWS